MHYNFQVVMSLYVYSSALYTLIVEIEYTIFSDFCVQQINLYHLFVFIFSLRGTEKHYIQHTTLIHG